MTIRLYHAEAHDNARRVKDALDRRALSHRWNLPLAASLLGVLAFSAGAWYALISLVRWIFR